MNLFRSEEHARQWDEFDADTEHLLRPVQWWADAFATPMFRARGRADFISWLTSEQGADAVAQFRALLAPPAPDVAAAMAAVVELCSVDLSAIKGARPETRSVEEHLLRHWPAAVPLEEAQHWRDAAAAMLVAIPASPPEGSDPRSWSETRRSAVRDVQAADGWLKRAESGAGDARLADRLRSMGWTGQAADQPAWTAMEQSARAVLQCQHLADLH